MKDKTCVLYALIIRPTGTEGPDKVDKRYANKTQILLVEDFFFQFVIGLVLVESERSLEKDFCP